MINGIIHKAFSKRWRLRLKAGALALVFAVYALLPWFHVMTAGSDHAGHRCCRQVASETPVRSAPALVVQTADASDTCWVCQGLASLLQHNERTGTAVFVGSSPASTSVARAPHAPVLPQIFSANRAQAPPARV